MNILHRKYNMSCLLEDRRITTWGRQVGLLVRGKNKYVLEDGVHWELGLKRWGGPVSYAYQFGFVS